VKVGDQLICYRRGFGFSEFFAILEVTSQPFWDNRPIWTDDIYPVRLNVRQVLAPRQPIKFTKVYKRLSLYRRLRDPHNHRCWSNHFHQALKSWTPKDARVVINSLNRQAAREHAGRATRVA
jgi:predicted RNA-binding protein